MKMSIYQETKKLNEYKKARILYQQGLPIRAVAEVSKRSHQWAWFVIRGKGIKSLEKLNLPDLTKNKIKP